MPPTCTPSSGCGATVSSPGSCFRRTRCSGAVRSSLIIPSKSLPPLIGVAPGSFNATVAVANESGLTCVNRFTPVPPECGLSR